ncbi:MAG: hypothetical protein ACTHKF_02355 [Candidatus Nitrosocosmicus sp.]
MSHQDRFTTKSLLLLISIVVLFSTPFIYKDNITAIAQQQQTSQQLTSQGIPIAVIPGLTGNILATVSFLIGTSAFLLGLRVQNASRTVIPSSSSTTSKSALPISIINKYFDLLILGLVLPSIVVDVYGILTVGSHLYPEDSPYLLLLFVLFIPIGIILFLVKKLHVLASMHLTD